MRIKAFSKIHPAVLMFYFMAVLLIAMFVSNPMIEIISIIAGALFCATLTSAKEKRSDAGFYTLLFILITITNPLFSHNGKTPLFFMNSKPVTLEAFVYGAAIAVMIISVMLWCKSYSFIMTSDKFIYLFGHVVPKLSLVLSMALRYIPLLKRQAKKVNRAQKAMGLYSADSLFDRVKSKLRVISVLIGWSIENAVEISHAMKARGYGLKGRTTYSNYRFRLSDLCLLIISVILLTITLAGVAGGYIFFAYYPEITKLDFSLPSIATYGAFTLFALLPFIIEVEENIRWNYCKSKI